MVSGFSERAWLEVDAFLDPFERAWQTGAVPDIAPYLPPRNHLRFREVLLEMVRVDMELRGQHVCGNGLESYRDQFPELFEDPAALSLLAFEEYRLRRQAGDAVTPDDYALRYGVATANWSEVPPQSPQLDEPVELRSRPTQAAASSNAADHGRNDSIAAQRVPEGSVPSGSAAGDSVADWETQTHFPKAGSHLLEFELQAELGRGAFSRVYLARQGDLANRRVVLKVSSESFAEADKLAQLQHAHIVPIYSVHQAGPLTAACMPYFGAATLADLLRELHGQKSIPPSGHVIVQTLQGCQSLTRRTEPVPEHDAAPHGDSAGTAIGRREAVGTAANLARDEEPAGALKTLSRLNYVEAVLWIGARLADGLSHAHERGILHRDLKPANILLADDGRPMLLDFNLSEDLKLGGGESAGFVGGTLPYMAPEQIRAFQQRTRGGDARSDLFSLGVILFELLTGRNPYPVRAGALHDLLPSLLEDRLQPPASLRRLNPAASPAIAAIVGRCLDPNPARRYQSAADLHEDLERQLKHLPLRHVREPSLRERAQKWTRRHPRLTAISSAALLTTGLALAVGTYVERERVAELRDDIAELMLGGQQALELGEADIAHGRFLAAWMKVQSEPALFDHQPGVAGWLDHSRRAVLQEQSKQRLPPRPYDQRRDEALLLSLLLEPEFREPIAVARKSIHDALQLTIPNDPGWEREREQLTLVEAELVALERGAAAALGFLDTTREFTSRLFHEQRAELLAELGRTAEASEVRQAAAQFPPDSMAGPLLRGMRRLRQKDFAAAGRDFEALLDVQPEHFTARLFQAICFLHEQRPAEAKVALTACIAQRPGCAWSRLFRSRAEAALADAEGAASDLKLALDMNPSEPLRQAASIPAAAQNRALHAVGP